FIQRRNVVPADLPALAAETPEDVRTRFAHIRGAHDRLRREIKAAGPTLFLVVGDDQNENLSTDCLPQIAVYTGGRFQARMRQEKEARTYEADPDFARRLIEAGVKSGFDIASIGRFKDDTLISHAHVQVLRAFLEEGAPARAALIFVNA